MTTYDFLNEFIDPSSFKIEHSEDEYLRVKEYAKAVRATTLYQIYKHNVFENEDRLSMRDFFRVCGQYFYYDKYVCTHGTEFYYYIIFGDHSVYNLTKDLLEQKIEQTSPETLDDLIEIIKAVGRL